RRSAWAPTAASNLVSCQGFRVDGQGAGGVQRWGGVRIAVGGADADRASTREHDPAAHHLRVAYVGGGAVKAGRRRGGGDREGPVPLRTGDLSGGFICGEGTRQHRAIGRNER